MAGWLSRSTKRCNKHHSHISFKNSWKQTPNSPFAHHLGGPMETRRLMDPHRLENSLVTSLKDIRGGVIVIIIIIISAVGLDRLLLLQKTGVQFPTPPWRVTTVSNSSSGCVTPSSGLHRHCKYIVHLMWK